MIESDIINKNITLTLSVDEILMLQDILHDFSEPMYRWQSDILNPLRNKIQDAYRKPIMEQADYEQKLLDEKNYWMKEAVPGTGEAVASHMVHAKACEMRFYYSIPGVNVDKDSLQNVDVAIDQVMEASEPPEPDFEMEL